MLQWCSVPPGKDLAKAIHHPRCVVSLHRTLDLLNAFLIKISSDARFQEPILTSCKCFKFQNQCVNISMFRITAQQQSVGKAPQNEKDLKKLHAAARRIKRHLWHNPPVKIQARGPCHTVGHEDKPAKHNKKPCKTKFSSNNMQPTSLRHQHHEAVSNLSWPLDTVIQIEYTWHVCRDLHIPSYT